MYMKKLLLGAFFAMAAGPAMAQITITAGDMPVNGDTLRYSAANPASSGLNFSITGPASTWNFSTLTPVAQGVDAYKTAAQVNIAYAATISPTAYGYKVADSIPGAPVSVKDVYNFFNKKPAAAPTRFVVEGFGAIVLTAPLAVTYSDEDEVYFFPLTYPHAADSSSFRLAYSGLGDFSQTGYRKTTVDGYGTIVTPYATSPVNVIRVRSEIVEIDSFTFGGNSQVIPRNTVEYKWLAPGEHYPLLNILTTKTGTTETVTAARYRDTKRAGVGVTNMNAPAMSFLQAYPNPAQGSVTLEVPTAWQYYTLHLYDATGKIVATTQNTARINTENLPAGNYMIMAESATGTLGVARFVK
jgi:hypothetical protein